MNPRYERSLVKHPYLQGTSIAFEHEQSFERVHQWLINQDDYVAIPPPDTHVSSFRSNIELNFESNIDSNTEELRPPPYQYRSDGHINNTHTSSEYNNFRKLESRKYNSPNLNRRRPNGSRESNINKGFVSTPDALDKIGSYYDNDLSTNKYIEPYQDYSAKVNTFPRRHKTEKQQAPIPNSLLQKSNMGQQLEKYQPLSYDQRVLPNRYASSTTKSEKKSKVVSKTKSRSLLRPKSWNDGKVSTYNKDLYEVQHDSGNCLDMSSSSMMGNMSLDTRRLFTSNLPDVALTAAKALHKRELSDSVPKMNYTSDNVHIRMSSAPETNIEKCIDDSSRLLYTDSSKRVPALIRKVKAFSWPKRAVIQSCPSLPCDECSALPVGAPLNKTESGYNTEKSEEKNDISSPTPKQGCNIEYEQSITPKHDCENNSEHSETPPARPPLPLLKSLKKSFSNKSHEAPSNISCTKETSEVILQVSSLLNPSSQYKVNDYGETNSLDIENIEDPVDSTLYNDKSVIDTEDFTSRRNNEILFDSSDCEVTEAHTYLLKNVYESSSENQYGTREEEIHEDVINSETEVLVKQQNFEDNLYIIPNESNSNCDKDEYENFEEITNEHDNFNDNLLTTNDICSIADSETSETSECDLSKRVSMSLRDLIRIHEQEIARVSGFPKTKSSDFEVKRKSCVLEVSNKTEHSDHWKRHTTIGLISDHEIIDESFIHQRNRCLSDTRYSNDERVFSPECEFRNDGMHSRVNSSLTSVEVEIKSPRSPSFSNNTFPKSKSPSVSSKPKKSVSSIVISTSCSSTQDVSDKLLSPTSITSQRSLFSKDISIQTEISSQNGNTLLQKEAIHQSEISLYEDQIIYLTSENDRIKEEFQVERNELYKKLDEQKKVANAYQKLEDRYRRKVYELEKHFQKCSCPTGVKRNYMENTEDGWSSRTISPYYQIEDRHHEISVEKVDGILHQLEAWLNNQTNVGVITDTSEVSSLLESIADEQASYTRYKVTDHYPSPPLEIIDQIDATSV